MNQMYFSSVNSSNLEFWSAFASNSVQILNFYVLLTVHLSIILHKPNLMHKILFYNKFIKCLYMFRALLCSSSGCQNCIIQPLVSSHWNIITKIQFCKYEQIVVKFMCEFLRCDYCVLLTVSMLCHVEVMLSYKFKRLLTRYTQQT